MPEKCRINHGFSSKSRILPRIDFRLGSQETVPQSLTALTLHRYNQPHNPPKYNNNNNRQTII